MRSGILLLVMIILMLPQNVRASEVSPDSGTLWLINAENRLEEKYVPQSMEEYQCLLMKSCVIKPYSEMLEAMKSEGLTDFFIQSAYRSYGHQSEIFLRKKNSYLNKGEDAETAERYAANTVAYPGASEHQSGLALDITVDGQLRASFGETEQGKWLKENCHRFGFIIRYPQDKTKITGIIYEPWHIRYVGVPHAAFMKEKNLCFEEYMDYLAENERYIFWIDDSSYYLVSVFDSKEEAAKIPVADISTDRRGESARYIITEQKNLNL